MEQEGLSFYGTLLIWNDILSCSMRAIESPNTDSYRSLFRDSEFLCNFQEILTCEGWVLSSILDAAQLATWKRQQQEQGNLSIRGLVSRSEKIETTILRGIERLSPIVKCIPSVPPVRPSDVHTFIFAHALIVHLHTIISGYSPGIPEVQQGMERAMDAWQLHPSLVDLRSLAWPYYVTARLARGPQRDLLRNIVETSSLKFQEPALHHFRELKSLTEDCWREVDILSSQSASPDQSGIPNDRFLNIVFF